MKRSGPIKRKTPMKRSLSQLRRSPLKKKPSKGLRPRSKKRAAEESVYRKNAAAFLQRNPYCKVCQDFNEILKEDFIFHPAVFPIQPATEVHHMGRRHGKWLLDERLWLPICHYHHVFVEENGNFARAKGWLLTPEQKRQFQ